MSAVAGKWRAMGRSVRGAAHTQQNRPNQDALAIRRGRHGTLAMAVADGHGNSKHFRSEIGAALAVDSAFCVLESLEPEQVASVSERIVAHWRAAVAQHLAAHPYLQNETPEGPWVPYGTTLLAALAGDEWVLYLQLGDGDILAVDENGRTERPLPPDPALDGIHTASLCQPDSAGCMRIRLVRSSPALIAISTDGYSNSYADDAGFLQIGPDYLKLFRDDPDSLEKRIENILEQVSREGSGDDITLGLIFRNHAGPAPEPSPRGKRRLVIGVGVALLLAASLVAIMMFAWLFRSPELPKPPGPPPPPLELPAG